MRFGSASPPAVWLGFLVFLHLCPSPAPEIIDRILAVVDGALITLGDVQAALELGLVAEPRGTDRTRAALDELIERALLLHEVNRYGPRQPPPASVDEAMLALHARFGFGTALEDKLKTLGLTEARLRDLVRDDLRIRNYVDQRFPPPSPPTEAEIARYYHERENDFRSGDRLRPLSEVREMIVEGLQAERRRALIQGWVDSLRSRADIRVLYLPEGDI